MDKRRIQRRYAFSPRVDPALIPAPATLAVRAQRVPPRRRLQISARAAQTRGQRVGEDMSKTCHPAAHGLRKGSERRQRVPRTRSRDVRRRQSSTTLLLLAVLVVALSAGAAYSGEIEDDFEASYQADFEGHGDWLRVHNVSVDEGLLWTTATLSYDVGDEVYDLRRERVSWHTPAFVAVALVASPVVLVLLPVACVLGVSAWARPDRSYERDERGSCAAFGPSSALLAPAVWGAIAAARVAARERRELFDGLLAEARKDGARVGGLRPKGQPWRKCPPAYRRAPIRRTPMMW